MSRDPFFLFLRSGAGNAGYLQDAVLLVTENPRQLGRILVTSETGSTRRRGVQGIATVSRTKPVTSMCATSFYRFLLLLLMMPFLASCDLESDDPDLDHHDGNVSASSTLVGEWVLQSLVDKSGFMLGGTNRSVTAGTATSFTVESGGQVFQTVFLIDGGIVFTTSNYEVRLNTTVTISGVGTNSDTTIDTGEYTVSGGTMTLTSDSPDPDDPGPIVLSWSIDGGVLMLEDDESRMLFTR